MTMNIREARIQDRNIWVEMRTSLWPKTRDDHEPEIQEYFEGKSMDIVQAYVAELDDEVIGFIELNIRHFAEGSRRSKVPYVEAWYIKPDFQGRGYGKKLMFQAESWALLKGYTELASDTEVVNERSIQMHKQMGFHETERVVCFLKNLQK